MSDRFPMAGTLDTPYYREAFTPTKSDTADEAVFGRALYVGVAGDVKLTTVGGDDVVFANLPVGIHPVRFTRIWSTGTAATDLLGLV